MQPVMSGSGRELGRANADAAAVLLLLQSALAALSALGELVFAAYAHVPLAGGRLLPLLMPLLWLALGLGVSGTRRWLRRTALIAEASALFVGLALHLLPGTTFTLTSLLSTVILPAAITALLRSSATRDLSSSP